MSGISLAGKLLLLLLLAPIAKAASDIRNISLCGDKAGWPPYTYEQDGRVQGYDADVLREILTPANIRFDIKMLPWKRCLQSVSKGHIDVALSASGTPERRRLYRLTLPYYSVTPSYIYRKSRFPEGLELAPQIAAKYYKICGLRGYSYTSFGLSPAQVEATSNQFSQLFSKTAAGRCDLLLARYEILQGFEYTGTPLLTPEWTHTPVPGTAPDYFHMMVSRAVPNSRDIQTLLNQGIRRLQQQQSLNRLLRQYLPEPKAALSDF